MHLIVSENVSPLKKKKWLYLPGEDFHCNSGECISKSWQCDYVKDCLDGSDELNCGTKTCGSNMFQCKTGTCITKSWECDGDIDCVDGSDEHDKCRKLIFFKTNPHVWIHVISYWEISFFL